MTTKVYESALSTDNSLVDRAVAILSRSPAALITDIDGTISPIVPVPSEARVLPEAVDALSRLATMLPVVAVVTGRRVEDAKRMVGLPNLTYIGNHGLEYAGPDGPVYAAEAVPYVERLERALAEIASHLYSPGLLIENKGITASLHYRLAAEPLAAREEILAAIARSPSARELAVEHGRLVVNLLPPVNVDKGVAVAALAREYGLQGVVYLGDDCTDLHAFRALALLRQEGISTLDIAVGTSEATIQVRAEATALVRSVPEAADFLGQVAAEMRARGEPRPDPSRSA